MDMNATGIDNAKAKKNTTASKYETIRKNSRSCQNSIVKRNLNIFVNYPIN